MSGAAGLAYEVLWSRSLVVSLGNSADGSAAVLTAFMGAMGLGAALLGRAADRVKDPLLLYAALEVVLAICAMAVPRAAHDLLPRVAAALLSSGAPVTGWVVRLALAVALVAVPAAIMGATLPLLARTLASTNAHATRLFGFLYMSNTAGACVGAAAAGFVLVPALGVGAASGLAALSNLLAAGLAIAARRRVLAPRATPRAAHEKLDDRRTFVLAASMCAASGLLMLLSERIWSRLLVLVLGHDTYGFAAMLVAAILGLSAGGALAGALGRERARALGWAAALLVAGACLDMCLFWVTTWICTRTSGDPLGILASAELATLPTRGLVHPLSISLLPVLLPSVAIGAVFPLCCAAASPRPERTGSELGRLTAINAAGSVAGALLPSMGLVGLLGVQGALTAGAVLAAAVAALVLVRTPRTGRAMPHLTGAAALAAVAAVAVTAPADIVRDLTHAMVGGPTQRIIYHAEGRTGTVTVTQDRLDQTRQLFVNAVNEVSTRYVHDQSFSLLGHLGPLLHPDPHSVLVICYGAGLTAGAAATHDGVEVTVVDLEKRVVEASRLFEDMNGGLHEKTNVRVLVEDGRNHLLSSSDRYDVITVDSTHPRAVDSWVLYTSEFYELALGRLSEHGILVQWIPLHGMSEREFRILAGTFQNALPGAQLWANVGYDRIGFTGYALMVASADGQVPISAARIARRMSAPQVSAEMSRWGMDGPVDVLDCFIAGPKRLRSWTRGLPLNTDDRPVTPYVTGWSRGPRMGPASLAQVAEPVAGWLEESGDGDGHQALLETLEAYDLAESFLLRGQQDRAAAVVPGSRRHARYLKELFEARDHNAALAARHPDDAMVLLRAGAALVDLGDPGRSVKVLERVAGMTPDDPRPWFYLGLALERMGSHSRAERAQEHVLALAPDNVLALDNLAIAIMAQGDPYEATEILRDAARADPSFHRTWFLLGEAHMARGEPQIALENLERAIRLAPSDAQAQHAAGRALYSMGSIQSAIARYDLAIALDPGWAAPRYDRGLALLAVPDFERAEQAFLDTLRLEPSSADVHTDLGLALAGQDRWVEAAQAHLEATDLDANLARAWLNLGLALKALGEMEAAESALRTALILDPEIAGR